MNLASAVAPRYSATLIDGNIDGNASGSASCAVRENNYVAAGITVMGGPQVATAIEASKALRRENPALPIIWGGYFPTLYPDVALNADYVDFVVRGQGEDTFSSLLDAICADHGELGSIPGLSWKSNSNVRHNPDRPVRNALLAPRLNYDLLNDPKAYLTQTFLGDRTVGYQAALGCRFRCTFCGVAAMFNGATALPEAGLLDRDLTQLKTEIGADSIQFYDHNFFDRESEMIPLLEVLARHRMPWWCYARADALINLSPDSWKLVRESQLRMAYIGAETPNDSMLRSIRKGTKSEQTLEVVEVCRRNGVIPEMSFMVAPPEDPEGETERTFDFIRKIKKINPQAEIIIYVHTPLPPSSVPNAGRLNLAPLLDKDSLPVKFPRTPEEWTEPQWVDYACHMDAPWVSARLRRRIRDFATVLRCRFPTVQDVRSPVWAKSALCGLAFWRYATRRYDRPWELAAMHRLIGLLDPRTSSI
jgi:radical SAM superfamily enzyme YgiQ (UPF0313 family)